MSFCFPLLVIAEQDFDMLGFSMNEGFLTTSRSSTAFLFYGACSN